jgi:hypothetical protein
MAEGGTRVLKDLHAGVEFKGELLAGRRALTKLLPQGRDFSLHVRKDANGVVQVAVNEGRPEVEAFELLVWEGGLPELPRHLDQAVAQQDDDEEESVRVPQGHQKTLRSGQGVALCDQIDTEADQGNQGDEGHAELVPERIQDPVPGGEVSAL